MPARGLDVRTLRGAEAKRVRDLFEQKPILAEPDGGLGITLWVTVMLLGVGILALAMWRDWGVVTQWRSIGVLGWTAYATGGVLVARGFVGAVWVVRRRAPPTWTTGRFVFPFGFVEARGPVFRVLPVEDFESATITEDAGEQLVLQKVDVKFAGAPAERFHFATLPGQTIAPRLPELEVARDAIRAGRDADRLQLVAAGTPPPKRAWSKGRAWLVSLVVGLAVQAGAYLWWLPSRSVAEAEEWRAPERWLAIENAFPFGWVHDRAAAAIGHNFDEARARIRANVHDPAAVTALMAAVDQLAQQNRSRIGIHVDFASPPELEAATKAVKDAAGSAAEVAPVMLSRGIGDNTAASEMSKLVDGTSLEVSVQSSEEPYVRVDVHVRSNGQAYKFNSNRLYVALSVDVDATVVAGGKQFPLCPRTTIAPPSEMTTSQLVFEGDHARPLEQLDDPLVYRQMITRQVDPGVTACVRHAISP